MAKSVALWAVLLLHMGAAVSAKRSDSLPDTAHQENRVRKSHRQPTPGMEYLMESKPLPYSPFYKPAGKLLNRTALVTGADSGIGRAIALHFCLEGADVAVACLEEEMTDAKETQRLCGLDMPALVNEMIKINPDSKTEFLQELKTVRPKMRQSRVVIVTGDITIPAEANRIVQEAISKLGKIDILVNNAGMYRDSDGISNLSDELWEQTMRTNIFGGFYLSKAVSKQMEKNDAIISTASLAAFAGVAPVDYSASKGAVVAFVRALAHELQPRGIRVNAVAPGAVWTPLMASRGKEDVVEYPDRIGDTCELAPSYVFLASFDSNFMSGQVLHPNGGIQMIGGM